MRVGCIYTAYQTEEYVEMSLGPWMAAKEGRLGGHDYLICAVSVPFAGFEQPATKDRTIDIIKSAGVDHLITSDTPMTEVAARGEALQWLVDQGCDILWQVDSDEAYQVSDIQRLVAFVDSQPFVTWFRVCLKNLVFDDKHYLAEPFAPPRIHRVNPPRYKVQSFRADNDVQYTGTITQDIKPQDHFASMTISKEVAWPAHWSWLSDDRSRRKIEYQLKRWGSCSFAWENGLVFNKAYYAARGEPLPQVLSDSS